MKRKEPRLHTKRVARCKRSAKRKQKQVETSEGRKVEFGTNVNATANFLGLIARIGSVKNATKKHTAPPAKHPKKAMNLQTSQKVSSPSFSHPIHRSVRFASSDSPLPPRQREISLLLVRPVCTPERDVAGDRVLEGVPVGGWRGRESRGGERSGVVGRALGPAEGGELGGEGLRWLGHRKKELG